MILLVIQYKQPSEYILTHSVLLFLVTLIPSCFHCMDSYYHLVSLLLQHQYWLTQSSNIKCNNNILVLWAFRIITAFVMCSVGSSISLIVVCAVSWNIEVTIPVRANFGIWNATRNNVLITLGWIVVYICNLVDIQYLWLLSREVHCRQRRW